MIGKISHLYFQDLIDLIQDCISRKPLQIWRVQRLLSVGQPFVRATLGTSQNFSFQSGYSTDVRYNYVVNHTLNNLVDMQSDWYSTISQVFGIPLDSRHLYSKSDWELWTAATCAPAMRRLFVNAVTYWLNNTSTDRAFTDLYETIDTAAIQSVRTQFTLLRGRWLATISRCWRC